MLIALYESKHELPFSFRPTQPKHLFRPIDHTFPFSRREHGIECDNSNISMKDLWIWSILMGIHAVEMPRVMAHIASPCLYSDIRVCYFTKQIWIEFTNIPERHINEVPLIIDENVMLVGRLLEVSHATFSMLHSLHNDDQSEAFWQGYFTKKLHNEKRDANFQLNEVVKRTKLFDAIT